MWATPKMMTAAMTSSLIATTIWLITLESLMPAISTPITSSEMMTAGRSITPSAAEPSDAGTSRNVPSMTSWKYPEKLVASAAEPIVNSSARSQPMIHAISSPNVA